MRMLSVGEVITMFDNLCKGCKEQFIEKVNQQVLPGGPALRLLQQVAIEHGISVDEMKSPSHQRALVSARRDFARRARNKGYATTAIGQLLNRDHSTVVYWQNGRKKQ